jgi:hypothetical protein
LLLELAAELRIPGFLNELERREDVVGPPLQVSPKPDLIAERAGLAEHLLGRSLVVPESRCVRERL